MKSNNPILFAGAVLLLVLPLAGTAATLERDNFRTSVCNVKSMSIDFTIDQAFGEPLIRSKMKWVAGPNTAPTCLDELSSFFVTIIQDDGSQGYIAVNPRVGASGSGYGLALTSSPSWRSLICTSSRENASCLTQPEAQAALLNGLNFESFEVVTDASVVQPEKTVTTPLPEGNSDDALLAFDRLLDEIAQSPVRDEFGDSSSVSEPGMISNAAEAASQQVLNLLSAPLAEYSTPARQCESARAVSNWVNVKSDCKISFRREIEHDFLCADGGEKDRIRYAASVDLDFSQHVKAVLPLRDSGDGWFSVVLHLNDNIARNYVDVQSDRWQFSARSDNAESLSQLADSLNQLKTHCEAGI